MMYDQIPPIPGAGGGWRPPQENKGAKFVQVALLALALTMASLIVWGFVRDRERDYDGVAGSIAGAWGTEVTVSSPRICTDGRWLMPDSVVFDADVRTKHLQKGIYGVEVYNADIVVHGAFDTSVLDADEPGQPVLRMLVQGTGMTRTPVCRVGDRSVRMRTNGEYLEAPLGGEPLPALLEFSITMNLKGSEGLYVVGNAVRKTVNISGDAPSPSFAKGALPDVRSIDGDSFTSSWYVESDCSDLSDDYMTSSVGVSFLTGVDNYRKVNRSVKYGFIIIVLTFVSLFITETSMRRAIPLLNYSLIGAALVIFYILLLAFAEHTSFALAYLVASAMTTGLTGVYMWRMLQSAKAGLTLSGILALMYLLCYVMLSAADYALLIGSLLLFGALALSMRATLRRQ